MSAQLIGRCIGCRHDFATGPCGGCGAVEQCDGSCHDQDRDDCVRCGSQIWQEWCEECLSYSDPVT